MTGFLVRWVSAFVLLSSTYNPTSWSYVAWISDNYRTSTAMAVLIGLLLFVGYIVYVRATLRSIGMFGMLLTSAIVASLIWVLIEQGILTFENPDVRIWLGLVGLSFVLGIGLSWSHIRRWLSGQTDVDDLED